MRSLLFSLLCPPTMARRLSVCLSVCHVPNHKRRMEQHNKLKMDTKEAHDMGDPRPHSEIERSKVKVTRPLNARDRKPTVSPEREGLRTSNLVHRWSTMMRGDLQAESSEWLFRSPLAEGGGILQRPHYRPPSLFVQVCTRYLRKS